MTAKDYNPLEPLWTSAALSLIFLAFDVVLLQTIRIPAVERLRNIVFFNTSHLVMADTVSIEETNRIRISLGLKTLPVPGAGPTFKSSKDDSDSSSEEEEPGSTLESRQAEGYDNWKKLQEEQVAKARREAKKKAVKKAHDAAQKHAKLGGKSLGEADETTEMDTKTWLLKAKKRQRKLKEEREKAARIEKELREREDAIQYTGEDLEGVKVGHEIDDFEGEGEQVLTLKDTTIEENEEEGDELENLDLREKERLGEKLELKKRKPIYNPNDLDDGEDKVLLKHYDEAIEGRKRKRFTLDAHGSTAEEREAGAQSGRQKSRPQAISLDILKDLPTSDYIEVSDFKVRKPRTKKAKSTRHKAVDEGDIFPTVETVNETKVDGDAMDVDVGQEATAPPPSRSRTDNVSFVDDDELQASLAKSRREALKQRRKVKPEDIARQVHEEASATPGGGAGDDGTPEEVGLIIDETSEFVANLQRPTIPEKPKTPSKANDIAKARSMSPSAADEDGDVDMERSHNEVETEDDATASIKRETSTPVPADIPVTGLDEEAALTNGIGSTLTLLSQRGLIDKANTSDINALHRERQKFLAEKQKREAAAEQKARLQRERDRASGKLDRMSAREREEYARWENKQRDQQESRQMAEIFSKEYKPDVQLKYIDEFGRSMNKKEAFKHLSHQFHGKGSGKQKTEKHLKKIEEEKKKLAQSSLDSSEMSGLNSALGQTAKKNRQAGVRLA